MKMPRLGGALLLAIILASCALDSEEDVRSALLLWLDLDKTLDFSSRSTCTVAVFSVKSAFVGPSIVRAESIKDGLEHSRAGAPVVFALPDMSPNAVSEAIMSQDLPSGLGLLSSGVGPALSCMSEQTQRGFYAAIMASDAMTIYDPGGNVLIVLQGPEKRAYFLRGNVQAVIRSGSRADRGFPAVAWASCRSSG